MSPRRRVFCVALCAALPVATLGAQALRLRATETTTGQPLTGAIADVLDAQGASAAQVLLRDDGRRLVPLAAPGTYTVRVRRIGYEPFVSPPVVVAGTDTVDVALRVPARRVVLSAMRVTGARRCAREASAAGVVATLLEEARKALTATALTTNASTANTPAAATPLVSRTFRRRVSVDGDPLEVSVALPRRNDTHPFAAIAARSLSDSGYLRARRDGVTFFGPDADVLLSDEFLRDHCFEAVSGRGTADGLLGVRFTPVPRRRPPDIAGTLWIDSASAELRYLDFWYATNVLPAPTVGEGRSGGRVVFESLAGGGWVVSAWHLRMPRFGTPFVTRQTRPTGYVESGGVVTGIAPPDGGRPPSLALVLAPYEALTFPARIEGAVFDSLRMRPLAGAEVTLAPTLSGELAQEDDWVAVGPRGARTDSAGRYTLDSIPGGTYRLTFASPAYDSAGALLPRYDVRLSPGALVQGDVSTPSRRTLLSGCARPKGEAGAEGEGIIFGTVRSDADRLVSNADVRASWIGARTGKVVEVSTSTDRAGVYRVCGVPLGTPASVVAVASRDTVGPIIARLPSLGVQRHDVTVATATRSARDTPSALLRGVARRADGVALSGVRIALGADSTVVTASDERGRFLLAALAEGPRTFTATLPGYVPLTFSAELRRHRVTTVELRMDAAARVRTP